MFLLEIRTRWGIDLTCLTYILRGGAYRKSCIHTLFATLLIALLICLFGDISPKNAIEFQPTFIRPRKTWPCLGPSFYPHHPFKDQTGYQNPFPSIRGQYILTMDRVPNWLPLPDQLNLWIGNCFRIWLRSNSIEPVIRCYDRQFHHDSAHNQHLLIISRITLLYRERVEASFPLLPGDCRNTIQRSTLKL